MAEGPHHFVMNFELLSTLPGNVYQPTSTMQPTVRYMHWVPGTHTPHFSAALLIYCAWVLVQGLGAVWRTGTASTIYTVETSSQCTGFPQYTVAAKFGHFRFTSHHNPGQIWETSTFPSCAKSPFLVPASLLFSLFVRFSVLWMAFYGTYVSFYKLQYSTWYCSTA